MATRNPVMLNAKRLMRGVPVKGNTKINRGEIVMQVTATGFAVPGGLTANCRGVGIAAVDADNTGGADGAITVDVWQGTFLLDNDTGHPVTKPGMPASAINPNAVDDGTNGLSVIGTCVGLGFSGEPGVQVEIEQ